jgi:hypothetical protein
MARTWTTAPAIIVADITTPATPRVTSGCHRERAATRGSSRMLGSGFQTKPIAEKWGSSPNRT